MHTESKDSLAVLALLEAVPLELSRCSALAAPNSFKHATPPGPQNCGAPTARVTTANIHGTPTTASLIRLRPRTRLRFSRVRQRRHWLWNSRQSLRQFCQARCSRLVVQQPHYRSR